MLIFTSLLVLLVTNCFADEEDLQPCTLKNGGPGVCVQPHLCIDGKVNRNGTYLIDIRFGAVENGCHYLLDCCDADDTEQPSFPPPPPPVTQSYESTTDEYGTPPSVTQSPSPPPKIFKRRCGLRNPNGIGYRILELVENESEYGEFPWMVAVQKKQGVEGIPDVYAGGGSLIHASIVLTAAHIVSERDPTILRARVGEWDTTTDNERFEHVIHDVADLIIHPNFDETILYNDVALLFLEKPVYFEQHIGTVCLPPEYQNFDMSRCFVSGWGKNRFEKEGIYQSILKKIEVPFITRSDCQAKLRKTRLGRWYELHDSFVCAGGEAGRDPCVGDGGSPLVCPIEGVEDHYYQAGIVAWGIGCGLQDVPGVYVNVAKYRTWIDEQVMKRSYDTEPYTNPSF